MKGLMIGKVIGANEYFVSYTNKKGNNEYPFNGTKKECKVFAEELKAAFKNKKNKKSK